MNKREKKIKFNKTNEEKTLPPTECMHARIKINSAYDVTTANEYKKRKTGKNIKDK